MIRRLLVLVLAVLVAVIVVRNAAVNALADTAPAAAARAWTSHPDAELALGMMEIGTAARERKAVGPPFLVHGVQADLAGNRALAAQAFMAAELRDPRSLPAHYFLADVFYRSGDPRRTLQQIAALARLAPNGPLTVGPYLAAYAKNRAAWPYLRELFRSNPGLGDASLTALARDPANADAVLALADMRSAAGGNWAPSLVNSLVAAGEYAKARAVWQATWGLQLPSGATLYDAGFADAKARPPFNWDLVSSTVGLAERAGGGRLHVLYYGHDDGVLAQQLMLLPSGAYRLTMAVEGDLSQAGAMSWSVRCDRSPKPFASVGLAAAGRGWVFAVPPGCSAQWLELSGTSSDVSQQVEATISKLSLVRVGGGG